MTEKEKKIMICGINDLMLRDKQDVIIDKTLHSDLIHSIQIFDREPILEEESKEWYVCPKCNGTCGHDDEQFYYLRYYCSNSGIITSDLKTRKV